MLTNRFAVVAFLTILIALVPAYFLFSQKPQTTDKETTALISPRVNLNRSQKSPLFISLLKTDGKQLTKNEWESLYDKNGYKFKTMYALQNYDARDGLQSTITKTIDNPIFWISHLGSAEITNDGKKLFYLNGVDRRDGYYFDEVYLIDNSGEKILPVTSKDWNLPTYTLDYSAMNMTGKKCTFSPDSQFLACQLIHHNIETFINTYKFVYYDFALNKINDIYSRDLKSIGGELTIPTLIGWLDNENILVFDAVGINDKTDNIVQFNIKTGDKKEFMSYPSTYKKYCYANSVTETAVNGSIFVCYDNDLTRVNNGKDHLYGFAEIDVNSRQIKKIFSPTDYTVYFPLVASNNKNYVVWSYLQADRSKKSTEVHIYDIKKQVEQIINIEGDVSVGGYIEDLNKLVLRSNIPDIRTQFAETFLYDLNTREKTKIGGTYVGYGSL